MNIEIRYQELTSVYDLLKKHNINVVHTWSDKRDKYIQLCLSEYYANNMHITGLFIQDLKMLGLPVCVKINGF